MARALFSTLMLLLCFWSVEKRASSSALPRLLVYVNTEVKPRVLKSDLTARMPSVEVLVFGRYRDFARALETGPDATLAQADVLGQHQLSADLRGIRDGSDSEPYVLLSVGAPVDKEQRAQQIVGAVDLLGREHTTEFVHSLLGVPEVAGIKYVVKVMDLLPLLQFRLASAVLLSKAQANAIRERSKLDLRSAPLETRVDLPVVSFHTDRGRQIVKPLLFALDAETKRKLGVEAWR